MVARLIRRVLGHRPGTTFRRVVEGLACPRCLVVLDSRLGNRQARRRERFGRRR